jgi:hypothetical protein
VNKFLDGSNACVPVNLVSTNGICLPGAIEKNLGEIDAGIPLESADQEAADDNSMYAVLQDDLV